MHEQISFDYVSEDVESGYNKTVTMSFSGSGMWSEHLEKFLEFLTSIGYDISPKKRDNILLEAESTGLDPQSCQCINNHKSPIFNVAPAYDDLPLPEYRQRDLE